MSDYAITQISSIPVIHEYLMTDANFAAYALGDLDEPYFSETEWWAASRTGAIEGLLLIFRGLDPPALFGMGAPPALSALLLHNETPSPIMYILPPDLEDMVGDVFNIEHQDNMLRMRVNAGTFIPYEAPAEHAQRVVQMDRTHASAIEELLRAVAEHDDRKDSIAFDAAMIDAGFYFGIPHGSEILAVGGTHLVSETQSIAAIGNIVVHPRVRRQGLGSLITSRITQALIDAEFNLIVLNVRQDNGPAIKVYRKLGFRNVGEFIEGFGHRRSTPQEIAV